MGEHGGGGKTPICRRPSSRTLGFSLVIFPAASCGAIAHAARDFYVTLARDGTSDAFRNRMFDFDALNGVIGTPEMIRLGKTYEDEA